MAKLIIEIDLNGAAMEDSQGGELLRLLRQLASKMEDAVYDGGGLAGFEDAWNGRTIRDINGNAVGQVVIVSDDPTAAMKVLLKLHENLTAEMVQLDAQMQRGRRR